MRIYVDLDTLNVITGPGTGIPVTRFEFKRGDAALLEVQFLEGGDTPVLLPVGAALVFTIKPDGAFAGDPLVFSDTWVAAVDPVTDFYTCEPNFNTTELNAAVGVATYIGTIGEISWTVTAKQTSTKTFACRIHNDVYKGDEGDPASADPPYPPPGTILVDSDVGVAVAAFSHNHDAAYEPLGPARPVFNPHTITGLTGGANKLDGLVTATGSYVVGTIVAVTLSNVVFFYQLQAGTDAESSPTIIRPDDYAGTTNEKIWRLVASGNAYGTVEDEGTPVTQRSTMNFAGAGVTVTDAGGKSLITIPGGGGGVSLADFAALHVRRWTSRASAADNSWQGIAWSPELHLFVAVASSGTDNRVMTSPDGIVWTSRDAATDTNWRAVCWSPELSLFVAVATSGTADRVMTSPDGTTWTTRTPASDRTWTSICWSPELDLFVAVSSGSTNAVMTSPDGTTWTSRNAASDRGWNGVAWSPTLGLFVAVADDGAAGSGNRAMSSTDGINWTTRTPVSTNEWTSVVWAEELGLFVAVGDFGTQKVMTSPDGINWTGRDADSNDDNWDGVAYSPELELLVAFSAGSGKVMSSPDGINWSARTSADSAKAWHRGCWSPALGLFAAIAYSGTGNRVMTSL